MLLCLLWIAGNGWNDVVEVVVMTTKKRKSNEKTVSTKLRPNPKSWLRVVVVVVCTIKCKM